MHVRQCQAAKNFPEDNKGTELNLTTESLVKNTKIKHFKEKNEISADFCRALIAKELLCFKSA